MGVAKDKFHIGFAQSLVYENDTKEPMLGIDLKTLMQLMCGIPKDARVISMKDTGANHNTLSAYVYELEIQSKYFKDGVELDMRWIREVAIDPETGELKQFATFQGINTKGLYTNNDDFQARQAELAKQELNNETE